MDHYLMHFKYSNYAFCELLHVLWCIPCTHIYTHVCSYYIVNDLFSFLLLDLQCLLFVFHSIFCLVC